MNHRHPTRASAGMRTALQCLSLLVLPAVACASNLNGQRRPGSSACPVSLPTVPYLPSIGTPALRFQEPVMVSTAPLASLNPPLKDASPELTTAATNAEAAVIPNHDSLTDAPMETKSFSPAGSGGAKIRAPAPILPDDSRPAVRPEDFLPFFQFPAAAGNGNVKVFVPLTPSSPPTPGTQPASSATYIQTP